MKRFLIIIALCLSCATGFAQWEDNWEWCKGTVPQTVEIDHNYLMSWTPDKVKYQWYVDQASAWQNVTEKDPKNEEAWLNLFHASYCSETKYGVYCFKGRREDSRTAIVMRKMKAAIPDTYTFNLCASQYWLDEWGEFDKNVVANALDQGLQKLHDEELKILTYNLWEIDRSDVSVLNGFLQLYDRQYFPERIMHYGWNLMLGMPDSAVYVANNTYNYEQMILMQEVFNTRKDITIIPCPAIHHKSFLNSIAKRLNIRPFDIDACKGLENEQINTLFIRDLCRQRNCSVYMPMNMTFYVNLDKDSLYNEGLLLKYSTKRYDNISVARHNFKEVYELEYLKQPIFVSDSWKRIRDIDHDVMRCVVNMAKKFSALGYLEDAARLENFIDKVYERDNMLGPGSRFNSRR